MWEQLSAERGIVLLGGGKMGGAMLDGWLRAGLAPDAVEVVDPLVSPALATLRDEAGVLVSPAPTRTTAAIIVLAVKPQIIADAMPAVAPLAGPDTLVVSVAAGVTLDFFESVFAAQTPILRSMPNTPAAVGRGVTAVVANQAADSKARATAEALLRAVGDVAWLENEAQMDAVTGVSGSGPAYVFHMVEALAAAGVAEGLPPELAMRLARGTVAGAGALLDASPETAETLRTNVTSPNGTTAAGLAELMAPETGLPPLMVRTVAAAARRSRELGS